MPLYEGTRDPTWRSPWGGGKDGDEEERKDSPPTSVGDGVGGRTGRTRSGPTLNPDRGRRDPSNGDGSRSFPEGAEDPSGDVDETLLHSRPSPPTRTLPLSRGSVGEDGETWDHRTSGSRPYGR